MKRKIIIGLLVGILAGVVDVIPMIIQKLTWDANLSAFSMWVIIGFFIAVTELRLKGIVKGIAVSYLLIIPVLILIGWKEPKSLIPILIMTTILGAISGYLIERFNTKTE